MTVFQEITIASKPIQPNSMMVYRSFWKICDHAMKPKHFLDCKMLQIRRPFSGGHLGSVSQRVTINCTITIDINRSSMANRVLKVLGKSVGAVVVAPW